jgi:hypothetical protein
MALSVGDIVVVESGDELVAAVITGARQQFGAYLVQFVNHSSSGHHTLILSEDIRAIGESELDRMARILYDTGMREHGQEQASGPGHTGEDS